MLGETAESGRQVMEKMVEIASPKRVHARCIPYRGKIYVCVKIVADLMNIKISGTEIIKTQPNIKQYEEQNSINSRQKKLVF